MGTFILGGTFHKNLSNAYRVRLLERVLLFGTRVNLSHISFNISLLSFISLNSLSSSYEIVERDMEDPALQLD